MNRLLLLSSIICIMACSTEDPRRADFDPSRSSDDKTVSFFNELQVFTAGPDESYGYDQAGLEEAVIQVIEKAELSIIAAFENLDSEAVANALVAASVRGIEVRIVADKDRREQRGFQILENAVENPAEQILTYEDRELPAQVYGRDHRLVVVYGDGELTAWQAVFGADNVRRTGEDNRMMHNCLIADRIHMVNLTHGFGPTTDAGGQEIPAMVQTGFFANSEDLAKDYGDILDQLYGGVFSTTLTFYDDTVSSDNNNRTFYPLQDGLIEAHFGPQEPLVKEIIDQIYSARSSVYIASSEFRNGEIARALRYKAEAGFEVRVVVSQPLNQREESGALIQWFAGLDNATIAQRPGIAQTMIIIDGRSSHLGGGHQPGRVMMTSMPIFEAAGYYVQSEIGGGSPVLAAQPSGQFTDTNMWVVHEGRNSAAGSLDYVQLEQLFDRLLQEAIQ